MATSSNIPESLAGLERELVEACRPAPDDEIKAWLTVLWMSTKKQGSLSEFNSENVFRIYATMLRRYPADMVCEALSTWTSIPKERGAHHWWPAVGEIEDTIRGPAETRRMIKDAVREWDVDQATHRRIAELHRQLAVLESGDFTFAIKHLMHARRAEQLKGIDDELQRVTAELIRLQGNGFHQRMAEI